jgi:hypothetical protein
MEAKIPLKKFLKSLSRSVKARSFAAIFCVIINIAKQTNSPRMILTNGL